MDLFIPNQLKEKVKEWRKTDYRCNYPAISEIFDFNFIEDGRENRTLRYLRKAQFEALETYWYLRLVEKTPSVFGLSKKFFSAKSLLESFGLKHMVENLPEEVITPGFVNKIIENILYDDKFVKDNKLDTVRESLSLKYPSYILALAMGAGKTILVGSIIATEFAMSLEYPDANFVKNALVFAPGKTILGALKEISDVPYDKILPERLYKQFITTVKFTYTRDGEKDIPIIRESSFNIIVTNTEKIRIRKESIKANLFSKYEKATDSKP